MRFEDVLPFLKHGYAIERKSKSKGKTREIIAKAREGIKRSNGSQAIFVTICIVDDKRNYYGVFLPSDEDLVADDWQIVEVFE